MTQQIINVGTVANDGQGTPLRTAFQYINDNFTELYSGSQGVTAIANGTSNVKVVSANGNISTSVNGTSNVAVFASTGAYVTGLISASGNVRGSYILGDGSQLTGLPVSYGNANVVANLAALGSNPVSTTGNITAGNLNAVNLVINNISSDDSTFITIEDGVNVNGVISATGNITGNFFIGNGSQLTGIAASYGNANVVANVAALGSNPVSTTGNITGGNILTGGVISATGNITGGNLSGTSIVGTLTTAAQTNITSVGTLGSLAVTGNTTSGNLLTGGLISATGNITGGNLSGTNIVGTLTTAAQTNITSVGTLGSLTITGNATGGNLLTGGLISATGNITGNFFIGNGSQLTGIAASYGNSNVVANLAALGTNPVSTTGNITGGNLLTGGLISVTGNITGGNILGGANVNATTHTGTTVSVTANVTGGNILTAGLISATGNITGGNLSGTNIVGTLTTAAQTNITSVGTLGSLTVTANTTSGNLLTGGLISATGNITGNFFIGNGSQLTGIAASYGNANVVANLAALGSNPVSTTGNITGGNVLGGANVNATTHTGTTVSVTANITGGNILFGSGIVSGTGNIFGGNLTIAGNTATITTASYSIGYLNVPQVSLAANATTALTDSGKHYYSTSASNLTLTIADNSAVSWPVGTSFIVVNRGTGNITVAPAAGVSLYLAGNSTSANRVLTTYNLATCLNLAANVWMISGSGLV